MDHGREGSVPDSQRDYVWRFSLDESRPARVYDDPLVEMVRAFLADFLNMGCLTRGGRRVKVDGFVFNRDPKAVYRVFPDNE